jgi:hypothetical protein
VGAVARAISVATLKTLKKVLQKVSMTSTERDIMSKSKSRHQECTQTKQKGEKGKKDVAEG